MFLKIKDTVLNMNQVTITSISQADKENNDYSSWRIWVHYSDGSSCEESLFSRGGRTIKTAFLQFETKEERDKLFGELCEYTECKELSELLAVD